MTTKINRDLKIVLLEILQTGEITDKQRNVLTYNIGLPETITTDDLGLSKLTDEELKMLIYGLPDGTLDDLTDEEFEGFAKRRREKAQRQR